ncbi:MAG: hypothetical protein ACLRFI_03750 [Alphaproteobacteria bacterium]
MSFRIIKYDETTNTRNNGQNVMSIPGDEVCTVFLPGIGVAPGENMQKIGHIVAREYLDGLPNVGNYVVGYIFNDSKTIQPSREIQYDRYNQNLLGIKKATSEEIQNNSFNLYITKTNINRIFNRVVLPALQEKNDINFTYIVDGDIEKIRPLIKQKLKSIAEQLQYTPGEIAKLSKHIYSYKKYFQPAYLDELFNAILLPRITDNNGKRLPLELAQRQIRKINIIAHCHGAYVSLMMHERLKTKMQELGYSGLEINKIFSQLLVVALNPDCPLAMTHSPFISFESGYNIHSMFTYTKHAGNYITDFVIKNPKKIKNGFLENTSGNVFFVKNRFKLLDYFGKIPSTNEHNNIHVNHLELTDDGKLLMSFMHNVIQSGVRNSMCQNSGFVPLPKINELILDGKNDAQITKIFNTMKSNGNDFLQSVYKHAKKLVSAKTSKTTHQQNASLFLTGQIHK